MDNNSNATAPAGGARQPHNPTNDPYALDFWEWAEKNGVNGAMRIDDKWRVDEVAVAYAAHRTAELERQLDELTKEYHAAINEPEYAGTREDWKHRAFLAENQRESAERRVEELRPAANAAIALLRGISTAKANRAADRLADLLKAEEQSNGSR